MISTDYGNKAMRIIINEMRLMTHPAKNWEIEFCHGQVRGVQKVLAVGADVVHEALAEVDALRTDKPARPYSKAVPSNAAAQYQF